MASEQSCATQAKSAGETGKSDRKALTATGIAIVSSSQRLVASEGCNEVINQYRRLTRDGSGSFPIVTM